MEKERWGESMRNYGELWVGLRVRGVPEALVQSNTGD